MANLKRDALARVRVAAVKLDAGAKKRNDEIRAAHAYGETIRAIAEAANLSPARVHQILHAK